ncbi:TPA: hypothetical protein DCZ15_01160 [Candidatus Falkowbacteria bacterium]|nr:MAG: hypothetical protein UV95_C0003G0095 [Candidatus Falkowbacteria bacterium GW2011_GWF2_43_32]HBA36465.1 hypothetical protein [Candidatus Falkowbacteria bacterium]
MKKFIFCFLFVGICCGFSFGQTVADSGENVPLLKIISEGEKIVIPALDGQDLIVNARETFRAYIDKNFEFPELDQSGPATREIIVDIAEMTGDGTFAQIFRSINRDLDKSDLTQAQIIYFCETYYDRLRQDGQATFFLTRSDNQWFVTPVHVYPNGLIIYADRFAYDLLWYGEFGHYVVFPRLAVAK